MLRKTGLALMIHRRRHRATYEHPQYRARSPFGFWIESVVIALFSLALIGALVAMITYA
jgi:hypothetical protein